MYSDYTLYSSVELMGAPVLDYKAIEREMSMVVQDWKIKQNKLSERAHMLRKKWLPSRPKKVRWRKG